jgi:hypothetical protein
LRKYAGVPGGKLFYRTPDDFIVAVDALQLTGILAPGYSQSPLPGLVHTSLPGFVHTSLPGFVRAASKECEMTVARARLPVAMLRSFARGGGKISAVFCRRS